MYTKRGKFVENDYRGQLPYIIRTYREYVGSFNTRAGRISFFLYAFRTRDANVIGKLFSER